MITDSYVNIEHISLLFFTYAFYLISFILKLYNSTVFSVFIGDSTLGIFIVSDYSDSIFNDVGFYLFIFLIFGFS